MFLVKIKGSVSHKDARGLYVYRWHTLICSYDTLQRMKKVGPRGTGGELVDADFTVKPL